ncbi:hypothetical protein OSTOST_02092, partial [Ostertagia ostertagi]
RLDLVVAKDYSFKVLSIWTSFRAATGIVSSTSLKQLLQSRHVYVPSIVETMFRYDIRGHHFDIVYHDAMDEHVKCQHGRRDVASSETMFCQTNVRNAPELCPSISTDDDSGRHSGLESPDISRNPSFPFSPKLMSPPITKEPIKLTISLV